MAANPDLGRRHLPDVASPELAPFWEGCRAGELRIPRCNACGKLVWYPQLTCSGCGGEDMSWSRVSGRGRLFTWVRVHRAFLPGFEKRLPFTSALVEIEEDRSVRLATLLDDASVEKPCIGMPVEAYFEMVEGAIVLPRFRAVSR